MTDLKVQASSWMPTIAGLYRKCYVPLTVARGGLMKLIKASVALVIAAGGLDRLGSV